MYPLVKALLALLIFTSLSCQKAQTSQNEIILGEFEAMTGAEAVYGRDTHRGVEMAIEEVNERGGIGGKKVRLVLYDNQGKTEEAVTAVTRLITKDKVLALIGEVASTRSIAAGVVAQRYQIPMVSPSSTNPAVTEVGDYIFRVCFIDPFQGKVMARYARETLKLKNVAILRDLKSDYSEGLAKVFKEEFKSASGNVPLDISYSGGDLDFKSQLAAIKNTKADGLFLPGYYTDVGLIARQARELGFKGILLGGDGWDSDALTEIAGESIVGGYFSNHFSVDEKTSGISAFVSRYKAKHGVPPNSSSALGYDAAALVLDALKRADAQTPQALRKALAETKSFEGITGKLSFDKNRNVVKPAVVLKVASLQSFAFVKSISE